MMILTKFLLFIYFYIVLNISDAVSENGLNYHGDRELPFNSSTRLFERQRSSRLIVKRSHRDRYDDRNFCSSFCLCDTWYKLRRAKCNNRYLFSVQTGVSNSVQALDLSHNSVSSIQDYELKNIGLVNLKYLNLSYNSINQIGSFAFNGIEKLTVLDLSNNHLYYILWDTFVECLNLRIIHLNGNRFGTGIPELYSNSILELGLNNCQISHLTDKIFNGLKKLMRLDLSKNNMIEIDYRLINSMPMLKEINLNENPWSCKTDGIKNLLKQFHEKSISYKISSCEFDAKVSKILKNVYTKEFERMTDVRKESTVLNEEIKYQGSERKKNNNEDLFDAWTITESPSHPPYFHSSNSTKLNNKIAKFDQYLTSLSTISPILLLVTGFLIGIASSTICTYLWLAGSFSFTQCPPIPRRGNNESQRVSLLGQPICPGTPPPPYRDVLPVSSSSHVYPIAP